MSTSIKEESLSPNEKLYVHQCETLLTVYKHGAISKAQYYKSFNDLTKLMDMECLSQPYVDPDKIKDE